MPNNLIFAYLSFYVISNYKLILHNKKLLYNNLIIPKKLILFFKN